MRNVLVVEDNEDSYLLLSIALKSMGLTDRNIKRCARLGSVAGYEKETFDIIITDLELPDSTGLSTFSYVQSIFPCAPIIVLTSTAELTTAVQAIKLGAQEYLVKGCFNRDILEKSMQYAIERKRVTDDYRRLFQDSPVPMYIYDNDTLRFLMVNNAAIRQYGYTREEFLAMSATDIRPREEVDAFLMCIATLSLPYSDYGRWRHIRKDGALFYVHIYAHVTQFEGKAATTVLALDIDNKVKIENEIKEKSREINNILESITDGFYTLNRQWEITYFNKEAERALGVSRDEVLGKNLWDFFPQSRHGQFYKKYCYVMQEKASTHFEEYYAPKDMWASISVYPTNDGIAVYFVDMTEQKRIQEKLFIDEQNLRAIINNTDDIIWSMDRDMNVISANDAFWMRVERITGKEKALIRENDFGLHRLTAWKDHLNKAFSGKAYKALWTESVDGEEIHEEVSFNPILDRQGAVIGVSCFSRDITRQKNYIDIIEKKNEQLEKIAWIQSHEVRSPVASILGLVQLFKADDPGSPTNAQVLNMVKEAAVNLDTVIKKITACAVDK